LTPFAGVSDHKLIGRMTSETPCLAVTVALHVVAARFRSTARQRTTAMIQRSGRFEERDGACATATFLMVRSSTRACRTRQTEHGKRGRYRRPQQLFKTVIDFDNIHSR
jgi:hypothetical protein